MAAEIHKLQKNGKTIYPATTTDAVVDPDSKKTIKHAINSKFLYRGDFAFNKKVIDSNWSEFFLDARFPDIPLEEGYYYVPMCLSAYFSERYVSLYKIKEEDSSSSDMGLFKEAETIGNLSILKNSKYPKSYILVNKSKLKTEIGSVRANFGLALNERLFYNETKYQPSTVEDLSITSKKIADAAVERTKISSELENKIFGTGINIESVKEYDKSYISIDSSITSTTSNRAVAIYEIKPYSKLRLSIPKNGNSYSLTYAYLKNKDDKYCHKPSDGGVIGSEIKFFSEFTAENFNYIAVTYTTTDGKPTIQSVTENSIGEDKVAEMIDRALSEKNFYIEGVDIFIPRQIIAIKDDNLQIFWRSIVKAVNPYNFDIIGICSIGQSYPRYFTLLSNTINSHIGENVNLTIKIRDNNLKDIVSKQSTIKIIDLPLSPKEVKNILCVGASATAGGQWVHELNRRLTESTGDNTALNPTGLGLNNISFVGRKTGTYFKSIKLEATGGWTVQNYAGKGTPAYRFEVYNVTELKVGDVYVGGNSEFTISEINVTEGTGNIRCTYTGNPSLDDSGILNRKTGDGDMTISYSSYTSEYYNPFYDTSADKLNFTKYADDYCGGKIDYFLWHCGVNGIFSGTPESINNEVEAFKKILRAFHSEFPNSKVIISSVPIGSTTGGFGANYGANSVANYYTFLNQAMNYAKQLDDLCSDEEFSQYTFYSPAMEEFDSEYSYPSVEQNVNNRINIKEQLGSNGVHPTNDGAKLIADAMYRTICSIL